MDDRSSVRYARVGGVSLAYQTWGSGPATIVAIPPLAQNVELTWERPEYRRMFARLGSFATVLHFDKRGTGASDRSAGTPTLDQRVEDLLAIIDDAGIARAHLMGVSEGGPVALAFAATYPDRVEGVVLVCSGARMVGDLTDAERDARIELLDSFADLWGTDGSVTLDVLAPTAAADPTYREWEPRYERQSAGPAALRELLGMIEDIDVRPLLSSIDVPTLVIHRRGDRVCPLDVARETVAGISGARLVELDGVDHMAQVGDVDGWLDHVEEFTTGARNLRPVRPVVGRVSTELRTMGGFGVDVDGVEVPLAAWGSRRTRQLCKRLALAIGDPVPREQLVDMLWPEEDDPGRLGARLSVLLSNVRRVLGGGLIADRSAVRLDLATVQLDLAVVKRALAAGDDAGAVAAYRGPVLPEDPYEDWVIDVRERLSFAVIDARRRLGLAAESRGDHDLAVAHASAILEIDPFDERGHELLVRSLAADGRDGDAARANERYLSRMAELGVGARALLA